MAAKKEPKNIKVEVEPVIETEDKVEVLTGTVINCDQLRVRSDASFESEILGTLEKGTKVELIPASKNGWYKINNEERYVCAEYIEI